MLGLHCSLQRFFPLIRYDQWDQLTGEYRPGFVRKYRYNVRQEFGRHDEFAGTMLFRIHLAAIFVVLDVHTDASLCCAAAPLGQQRKLVVLRTYMGPEWLKSSRQWLNRRHSGALFLVAVRRRYSLFLFLLKHGPYGQKQSRDHRPDHES